MYCWNAAGGCAPYAAGGYWGRGCSGICPEPEFLPFWMLMTLHKSCSGSHCKRRRQPSKLTPQHVSAIIARHPSTMTAPPTRPMTTMIRDFLDHKLTDESFMSAIEIDTQILLIAVSSATWLLAGWLLRRVGVRERRRRRGRGARADSFVATREIHARLFEFWREERSSMSSPVNHPFMVKSPLLKIDKWVGRAA
jgi:hypothetical protein